MNVKKIAKNLGLTLVLSVSMLMGTYQVQAAENTPNKTYSIVFQEAFDNGLNGWASERTSIKQIGGNNYAFLDGYQDWPPLMKYAETGALQKTISGVTVGARYRVTLDASGVGKVAINSSDYKININTGSVNMNNAKTYSYEDVADKSSVQITIIAYGTKLGVDNIKVEAL